MPQKLLVPDWILNNITNGFNLRNVKINNTHIFLYTWFVKETPVDLLKGIIKLILNKTKFTDIVVYADTDLLVRMPTRLFVHLCACPVIFLSDTSLLQPTYDLKRNYQHVTWSQFFFRRKTKLRKCRMWYNVRTLGNSRS